MRPLIVDNHDSFTFNLFQLVARVTGVEPVVVRNDEVDWQTLRADGCDSVILSPGPGRPDRREDFGICLDILEDPRMPVLGVCLGHQGIAHAFGGTVRQAIEPMHGRASTVFHDDSDLFRGVSQGFRVVRYHSRLVAEPLPSDLERLAWTEDGILMALRHRERPLWGVQFHPEAVCSEFGERILANFFELSQTRRGHDGATQWSPASRSRMRSVVPEARKPSVEPAAYALRTRQLNVFREPEHVFQSLFSASKTSFWLDSSLVGDGRSRFSFMGGDLGPHGQEVVHRVEPRSLEVTRGGSRRIIDVPLLEYLDEQLRLHRIAPDHGLPFDFACGFVGYLGYELKAECGDEARHVSPHADARLVLADRVIVFDHEARCVHFVALVALDDASRDAERDAEAWLESTAANVIAIPVNAPTVRRAAASAADLAWSRSRERYVRDARTSLEQIDQGETYEICLTNKLRAKTNVDPLDFHRTLRAITPAPHAAFLRFGDFALSCASPERFLCIDRHGNVETKPIKGTARRGATPEEDERLALELGRGEKSRSENMMITDLSRNDLGTVCEIGSVHVPRLMHVESYATVHQLVTTVRGKLRAGLSAIDCVRACFPAGSMTGAPKRRTLKILDALEGEARGPYSGAVGFLSLDGTADLNVVIRTAVFEAGEVSIGVGGAIVALSNVTDELDELVLKARALVRALLVCTSEAESVEDRLTATERRLRGVDEAES